MTANITYERITARVNPDDGFLLAKDNNTFLLLHCVNHNLFGHRDPIQYGTTTLREIEEMVVKVGQELGVKVICAQTNIEGEVVELIHYARCLAGVVLNAGAFTHYSWALHDAIEATPTPVIEVHIANLHRRQEWRQHSCISRVCQGTIAGGGVMGYELGLRLAVQRSKEIPVATA